MRATDLRSRSSTYLLLVGVVVGMLAAALGVPFVFGESLQRSKSTVIAGSDPSQLGGAGSDATIATTDANGAAVAGGSAAPGSAAGSGTGANSAGRAAGGGAAGSGAAGSGALTASDRGVTSTTIKVGFMLLDLANLSGVGVAVPGVDPEQQRGAWQVYVDQINNSGGILGRKIEPVYEKYDILNPDDMRRACLAVTESPNKVFAVLDAGGMSGDSVLCVTEGHKTPMVMLGSQGMPRDWYARSNGMLFTHFPSGVRTMRNMMWELERLGQLKGRTIGVVEDTGPGNSDTIKAGVEDALKEINPSYKVEYRAKLAAPPDYSTAASQIPVEVQQMRVHNVDTVLLLTGNLYATQFVQNADNQKLTFKYVASDWASAYSDTYGSNMPDSFNGSLLFSVTRNNEWRVNKPEPAIDADCRRTWEQHEKKALDRRSISYSATLRACNLVRNFAIAAARVGPNLTRTALGPALLGQGQLPLAAFFGGTWGPNKYDAADYVRTFKWSTTCPPTDQNNVKCWMPVDEFRRTRY